MTHGPTVVRSFFSEAEAVLAQARLAAAEIPSVIQTETWADFIMRQTWRVAVRGADVTDALRVLDARPDVPDATGDDVAEKPDV